MFRIERQQFAVVVHVPDEVDFTVRASFAEALSSAADQWSGAIVVNLCECRYFDATGLSELIRTQSVVGKRLKIVLPPSGIVARIFAVTGLDRVLNVNPSVAAALLSEVA